jgi:hypothetical protein
MRRILISFLVATTLLVPACRKKTEGGNVVQLGADDPGLWPRPLKPSAAGPSSLRRSTSTGQVESAL